MDCSLLDFSSMGFGARASAGVGCHCLPDPGMNWAPGALQVNFLLLEPAEAPEGRDTSGDWD